MMRTTLGALAVATALLTGSSLSFAVESEQKAPAAAPADSTAPQGEKAGGCMPDGSCCGNAACAQSAAPAGAPEGAKAAGGCPCGKMKMKKAQEAQKGS